MNIKIKKYCPFCNTDTEHELINKSLQNNVITYQDNCKGNKDNPHSEEKITSLFQWKMWINKES